jgi:predicted RNA-binding protein (TIGR00451 family)
MSAKLQVRYLSGKERQQLEPLLSPIFPEDAIRKRLLKAGVKVLESEEANIIVLDRYMIVRKAGRLVPAVVESNEEILKSFPSIYVDRGAVGPVTSGADVMRPGITRFSGWFNQGDLVVVRDEIHSKALAIGEALQDKATAESSTRGKVLKNLHHVDDREWKIIASNTT